MNGQDGGLEAKLVSKSDLVQEKEWLKINQKGKENMLDLKCYGTHQEGGWIGIKNLFFLKNSFNKNEMSSMKIT